MQQPWSPADLTDTDVFAIDVTDWLAASVLTGDAVVSASVSATATPVGLVIADIWFDAARQFILLRIGASPVGLYSVLVTFSTAMGRQVTRAIKLPVRQF